MTNKYTGWLTDDNIQFILRHDNFWKEVSGAFKDNEDLNIVGETILLKTNTSTTYLAYQYSKISAESRNETQKNVLKRFKENWEKESKKQEYTIFPLTLGGHPGNHWGVLIIKKKVEFKAYWVDSIGGYKDQAKSLVAYLTDETTANRLKPLAPNSRQSDGYNCGVYACLYIREIVSEFKDRKRVGYDVLELSRKITPENLKNFRDEWSALIGEERWCKTGGYTEEEFGGWDWPSIGIYGEEQISQWFYGTDKPVGKKGLFFEHALDLILAGFSPDEGTFANWAYQEFRKQKAAEMSIDSELMDSISPHAFAQLFHNSSENISEWRKKYQEYLKSEEESEERREEERPPDPQEEVITKILEVCLDAWKDKSKGQEKEDVRQVIKKLANNQGTKREQHQSVLDLLSNYPSSKNIVKISELKAFLEEWKILLPKEEEETKKPEEEETKKPDEEEKPEETDEELNKKVFELLKDWLSKATGEIKEELKWIVKRLEQFKDQVISDDKDNIIEFYQRLFDLFDKHPKFKGTILEKWLAKLKKRYEITEIDLEEPLVPEWLEKPEEPKEPKPDPLKLWPTKSPIKTPYDPTRCSVCEKNTFYSRQEYILAHGIPKPEPSVWAFTKIIIRKKPIINKYMWICRVCKQEHHTPKCKYYSPYVPIIPAPEPFDWDGYWKWWFGVMTLDWDKPRFFG